MQGSFLRIRISTSLLWIVIAALVLAYGLKVRESQRLREELAASQAIIAKYQVAAAWEESIAEWSRYQKRTFLGPDLQPQQPSPKRIDEVDRPGPAR